MADEIDMANEQADKILKEYLTRRQPEGPKHTGCCLFCEEELTGTQRWCDAECRDLWEAENT